MRGAKRKAKTRRAVKAKTRAKKRPKHKFTVSHHREADFDQGLRTYAKYRDLGIAPATGGMVQAHVIRIHSAVPAGGGVDAALPRRRLPDGLCAQGLDTRPNSRAKACIPSTPAACWIQPPRIKHTVLGYSDDCELLEIVLPADFETVTLAE